MKTQCPGIPSYLDLELLARLSSLEVKSRYIVEGLMAGDHRSPLCGSNVEFKDFRAYQQGDPPKSIDWKVYARTERLQVQRREEETNLRAYLVIDASESMDYRSPSAMISKWDYARSIAGAIILLLNRQCDAAGLMLMEKDRWNLFRPSTKISQLHRMLEAMDRPCDAGSLSLSRALSELATIVAKRSLVFVLSDFYESPAKLEAPVRQLFHGGNEVVFFHVMDPVELDLGLDSPMLLQELETHLRLSVSPDALRRSYIQQLDTHRRQLQDMVQGGWGQYHLIRTDAPPFHALSACLIQRAGRGR